MKKGARGEGEGRERGGRGEGEGRERGGKGGESRILINFFIFFLCSISSGKVVLYLKHDGTMAGGLRHLHVLSMRT